MFLMTGVEISDFLASSFVIWSDMTTKTTIRIKFKFLLNLLINFSLDLVCFFTIVFSVTHVHQKLHAPDWLDVG